MISRKHLAVALSVAGLAAAGAVVAAEGSNAGCPAGEHAAGEHRHGQGERHARGHGHGMQRMAAMHARMGAMHAERHGQGQEHDHGAKQEEKKEESKQ